LTTTLNKISVLFVELIILKVCHSAIVCVFVIMRLDLLCYVYS